MTRWCGLSPPRSIEPMDRKPGYTGSPSLRATIRSPTSASCSSSSRTRDATFPRTRFTCHSRSSPSRNWTVAPYLTGAPVMRIASGRWRSKTRPNFRSAVISATSAASFERRSGSCTRSSNTSIRRRSSVILVDPFEWTVPPNLYVWAPALSPRSFTLDGACPSVATPPTPQQDRSPAGKCSRAPIRQFLSACAISSLWAADLRTTDVPRARLGALRDGLSRGLTLAGVDACSHAHVGL